MTITYDAFARTILANGDPIDDAMVDKLIVDIDDTFHFRAGRQTLLTLVSADATQAVIHPVCRYLAGLTWDGRPRLDTWLSTYAGAESSDYVRAVGALSLLAAVRRVRSPGCKFDELLILESPQGTLKSSALRTLCPQESWFSDDLPLGVTSKEVIERTVGKWIIEASELHGNRGREAEQLKAFLSRQIDGPVRLAYGRLSTSVPRQFVMVGTTNATAGYLKDSSGGRRFWPVTVQRFDLAALERDRDQLWAEAAAREALGEVIRLHQDLWMEAGGEQEDRRAADPWETILEPLFLGDGVATIDRVPVASVWEALKLEANQLNNQHADRVTAIAQRFGFTQKRRPRVDGEKLGLHWVRTEANS